MAIMEKKSYNKNTKNEDIKKYLEQQNFFPSFKIINVVGTNGKGSISHYLTENIKKYYKVGTFTSPHIFKANERIKINGQNISDDSLIKLINIIDKSKFHFFAIMFISAMLYFEKEKCDYVILEAGIGGHKDPTNIFDGVIGVITSLSKDHTEILGNSLEEIIEDKTKIMNKNMNFYYGNKLDPFEYIIKKNGKNSNLFKVNNNGKTYVQQNQKLATAILKKEFNIIEPIFNEPIGRATIQKINNSLAIIDVGHNAEGIKATKELLKKKNIEYRQVVITMSRKKDWSQLTTIFQNKKLFAYQINNDFISAKDINAINIKNLKTFYKKQNINTLYIGSFYSVGDILNEK